MKDTFNKLKIPTILGLGIIVSGIVTGVFLVLREQIVISKASPDVTAQNITLSNITDNLVTVSYQTSVPASSFITFGQTGPSETTVLDDRDNQSPKPYSMHYFTIKNLLPKTTYQYKIISGKVSSDILKFTTAAPVASQAGFRPIIGSVLDKNQPLDQGVVYLLIAGATTQSAQVKNSGNFLIPLSDIRKSDLSDRFVLSEDTTVKLTVISAKGQANILLKLNTSNLELGPIKIGEDLDLTAPSTKELNIYDLNGDCKTNAADNAIILQDFGPLGEAGKNPKNKKADLNKDGVVDQKDLDLMAKQINQ